MLEFFFAKGRPRMLELWREFDLMPPQQMVLGLWTSRERWASWRSRCTATTRTSPASSTGSPSAGWSSARRRGRPAGQARRAHRCRAGAAASSSAAAPSRHPRSLSFRGDLSTCCGSSPRSASSLRPDGCKRPRRRPDSSLPDVATRQGARARLLRRRAARSIGKVHRRSAPTRERATSSTGIVLDIRDSILPARRRWRSRRDRDRGDLRARGPSSPGAS